MEWIHVRSYIGSDGKKYDDYAPDGKRNLGMLTIEKDKRLGYRVRNVFVDSSIQRKGMATRGYLMANKKSISESKKPLRSSEIGYNKKSGPTSMSDDANALWSSLQRKGLAKKDGDHFVFQSSNPSRKYTIRYMLSSRSFDPRSIRTIRIGKSRRVRLKFGKRGNWSPKQKRSKAFGILKRRKRRS